MLNELQYQISLFIGVSDELEQQMSAEKDEMKYKQIQKELNEVEDFVGGIKKSIKNFALIIGVKVNE
ncbi:MAG: hypothetical protein WC998_08770 [Candidatus Paceibacterota bacterium]|jgi:hypothetical protein